MRLFCLRAWTLSAFVLLPALTGTGCDQRNEYRPPPLPKVTVAQPLEQEVTDYLEFTGTTRAFEEAEVRARVAGFLESIHFTAGDIVKKGELLFVIDPREYEAELHAALAEVESVRAQLERARIELDRARNLFQQKAGAEAEVVKWRGERDIARAAEARAKAKVEKARLNLSYTKVTAPISGRVSRNFVDLGNLVGEGKPTLLTTVTRFDPMYVYFNLNERDLLRVMAKYRDEFEQNKAGGGTPSAAKAEIPLFLGLATEEGYPHEGTYDFGESSVDPGTGTLQLRGVFPNPGPVPVLLPGLFSRLRMPIDKRSNALLVTERAIGADQGGRYLLAVDSQNVVEKRLVRMGQLVDGLRVIEEGLRPGEWVVVNGLQRARPGAKVDPERADMASLTVSALKAVAEASKKETTAAETPKKDMDAAARKPNKEEGKP
jgi:RND family efflux transporter MFP subunit